ncbi:hypothetical protein [Actinoplanes sp. NPDC051851]|uniref:hypothetical protein n=1 Tax=Actinoplanes sp. NPDC051851 TaxID=3154753 RepID=UPI00342392DC
MVPLTLRHRRSTLAVCCAFALVGGLTAGSCAESAPAPRPAAPPRERVRAGPLLDRTAGRLTVGDAASRVRVQLATLPGLMYRISTAAESGVEPVVSARAGRVTVRLRATGSDGLDELRIVLNREVRWDIRLPAGAGEQQLNLRGGRVSRVELGGSGLVEMWLPDPAGTVPVTFAGGAGSVLLAAEGRAPFRIRLDRGAGSVETPWTVNNGTAAGRILREPGWARAADRYAVRARGGLGTLLLRRLHPAAR